MISLDQAHAAPVAPTMNATFLIDIPIATKALRMARNVRSGVPDEAADYFPAPVDAAQCVLSPRWCGL
jgi:hypothetical protein